MNFARQRFGSKVRTRQDKRADLTSRLIWCRSLDGLTADQLARETGLPVAECRAALADERVRREARG